MRQNKLIGICKPFDFIERNYCSALFDVSPNVLPDGIIFWVLLVGGTKLIGWDLHGVKSGEGKVGHQEEEQEDAEAGEEVGGEPRLNSRDGVFIDEVGLSSCGGNDNFGSCLAYSSDEEKDEC